MRTAISVLLSAVLLLGTAAYAAADAADAEAAPPPPIETALPAEDGTEEPPADPAAGGSADEPEPEPEGSEDPKASAEPEDLPGVDGLPEGERAEQPDGNGDPAVPEETWTEPGNTSAAILNGGRYVFAEHGFYTSENGVWYRENGSERFLSEEDARNLNLAGGWLYYTVGDRVRRLDVDNGAAETVLIHDGDILQCYVMGDELRFLSGGRLYSCSAAAGDCRALETPPAAELAGFIPTPYGNIFLSGSVPSYTVWAETEPVCLGAEQVWRDGEWLVVVRDGQLLEGRLAELFSGTAAFRPYDLHGEMTRGNGLSAEQQLQNECDYYLSDDFAQLADHISVALDGISVSESPVKSTAYSLGMVTGNEENIVKRARRMADAEWTPLRDVLIYGCDDPAYMEEKSDFYTKAVATDGTETRGFFRAGKTYRGVPYAQPVLSGRYIGWEISLDGFLRETQDPDSAFYREHSTFTRNGPFYGSDCSALVSWAWYTPTRRTVAFLAQYDSAYIGTEPAMMRVGDILCDPDRHLALVTNIGYDQNGHIISVELMDQFPCKVRTICFGALFPDVEYQYYAPMSYLLENYLQNGFAIYRRQLASDVPATDERPEPAPEAAPQAAAWLLREEGMERKAAAYLRFAVGLTDTVETDR